MQKNARSPVKFRCRDTPHVEDLGKGSKSCSLADTPRADKSSLTIQGRVWAKRHKQRPCFVPRTLKQEADIFKTEQILNCGNNLGQPTEDVAGASKAIQSRERKHCHQFLSKEGTDTCIKTLLPPSELLLHVLNCKRSYYRACMGLVILNKRF